MKLKKLTALFLTLLMIFSLSASVFAFEKGAEPELPKNKAEFVSFRCFGSQRNTYLSASVSASREGDFSEKGIKVWDEEGNLLGQTSREDNIFDRRNNIHFYDYDLGIRLEPGRTYTYQIYTVLDGNKFESEPLTFTLKDEPDDRESLPITQEARKYIEVDENSHLIFAEPGMTTVKFLSFIKKRAVNTFCITGNIVGTGSEFDFESAVTDRVYYAVVMGDLNGDSKTTAADARKALRGAASIIILDPPYFAAADIDGNNRVTASDARIILRISAGLE